MSFRVFLTIILLALPFSEAHSWVERLRVLGLNGSMIGDPGYIRGFVSRSDPDFNDHRMQYHLPPNERTSGAGILPSDHICRESQRAVQTPDDKNFPPLRARPGDYIALQYQENGHVTLPETSPQKEGSGKIFIYGTQRPSADDKLASIHGVWTEDGTGGDGRGSLLATRPFDDGQCYQINDGKISTSRQTEFSKSPADPQGADLWCQSDIRLPRDVSMMYTLYWVWEWPFKPSDTKQPADIYTSCMDIYIVPEEVAFVSGQDLNEMGIRDQMLAS
jgi:hypothetical protein